MRFVYPENRNLAGIRPHGLVDLPSRIYLREYDEETPTNRHYRYVLQDVLDSLDEGLDLEKHVAKRIEDYKLSDRTPNWFSIFLGTPAKAQVMSVIQKLGHAISREIIGSWSKIFHTPTSARTISLEFSIDAQKEDMPYVTFIISDGESQFSLHERSLGFRWFFSFLLFTRFKQTKEKKTVFLFDEPAANLHARAQGELLKSFEKIVEGGHRIIYSTHSHYMIEPAWLSGAYIIENQAIDYDNDQEVGLLATRPTNIKAIAFKHFVSSSPDRVSYYQPILERLDYQESRLIPTKAIVITEGISDFHAYRVLGAEALAKAPFEFLPGLGAGASSPLISLCLGTGRDFIVLLDDDKAGRKEAQNYKEKWHLNRDAVMTLRDLNNALDGHALETLLGEETHSLISRNFGREGGTATKKEIGIFFAERAYTSGTTSLPKETVSLVCGLVEALSKQFESRDRLRYSRG
jgi:hypothetical protein